MSGCPFTAALGSAETRALLCVHTHAHTHTGESVQTEEYKRVAAASGAQLTVVDLASIPTGSLPTDAFTCAAIALSEGAAEHYKPALPSVLRSLKLGAPLYVLLASADATTSVIDALTLAGFVSPAPVSAGAHACVCAHKPSWEAGAVAKVTLKKKVPAPAPAPGGEAAAAAPVKTWGVSLSAPADLLDEDDLLAADKGPTVSAGAAAECGPTSGKRRACKNCSCGLKEQEPAPAPVILDTSVQETKKDTTKSACGNCWKGDAFRCGGCPHLGKPAFKPGTDGAVLLDMSTSDI